MRNFLINAFWNDGDGFSAKDFLMVLFGGLFALFLTIAFFAPFLGAAVSAVSLEAINSLSTVFMTIVGGVFAVQTVKEFKTTNSETPLTVPEHSLVESVLTVEGTKVDNTPKIQ